MSHLLTFTHPLVHRLYVVSLYPSILDYTNISWLLLDLIPFHICPAAGLDCEDQIDFCSEAKNVIPQRTQKLTKFAHI